MISKSVPLAATLIFASAIWVVSLATKGANLYCVYDVLLDLMSNRETDQIYPALEGCMAMDCILFGILKKFY